MNYTTAHEVEDQGKVETHAASMAADGWKGAPVVIWDNSFQITGVHRSAAADIAGIDMETISLEDVFEQDGADYAAAIEIFNNSDAYNAFIPIMEMLQLLSAETRAKYGIDME